MRTAFLSIVAVACLGCSGGAPTVKEKPLNVSAEILFKSERVGDTRYHNKPIRVYLEKGSYRVSPEYIEAYCVMEDTGCCVRFECAVVPISNKSALVVSGICRGRVVDGEHRAFRVDWYVRVEGCSYSVDGD